MKYWKEDLCQVLTAVFFMLIGKLDFNTNSFIECIGMIVLVIFGYAIMYIWADERQKRKNGDIK